MSTYIWQRKDWPVWRWDPTSLHQPLAEIGRLRGFLEGVARSLDNQHLQEVAAELMTQETVATSAIENIRLDPESVRSSVMRRLGLAVSKERATVAGPAVRGLIDVLAESVENRGPLTEQRLLGWHESLFPRGYSGSTPVLAGAFRGGKGPMQVVSGPAGREMVHFEAPRASALAKEIRRFLRWFNDESQEQPGAIRASIAHLWFETLHPFEDGNGRIGRAIFDLAMAQDAQMPDSSTIRLWAVSRVFEARRRDYYLHLERAQKGELEITGWLLWAARCVVDAQKQAQTVVERGNSITRFWLRYAGVSLNERQHKVLKTVLQSNDPAKDWITTRSYSKITNYPKVTAARDLKQLVEWGCVEPDAGAGGRSTRYRIRLH